MCVRDWLAALLVLIVALIVVWDFIAQTTGNSDQTISSIIRIWAHKVPVLPFAVGTLIGHLFW